MAELTLTRPATLQARKTRGFFTAAILLGLVLGIGVAEVIVRGMAPPPDTKAISLPSSPRQYGYPPHFTGYAGGVQFSTNSSGFRGPDFPEVNSAKDPAKDFNIVVVGDSYAFGYGVDYENTFPRIIERELSSSGAPIKVFDLAVPGYDTAEELATLKEFARRLHPDLILLSYHLNDIERRTASDEAASGGILQSWNLREHFYLARLLLPQLAGLSRWLRLPIRTTASAEVTDYVENSEAWRRNQSTLDQFIAFTQSIHARLGVVVVPYFVTLNQKHPALRAYAVAENYFSSRGIPVADAFHYVQGLNARKLWINRFDGHPNAIGHSYIARAVLDLIRDNNLAQSVPTKP
jgi:lysophospholipase L1-like esterase